jgi:hypothetical protein
MQLLHLNCAIFKFCRTKLLEALLKTYRPNYVNILVSPLHPAARQFCRSTYTITSVRTDLGDLSSGGQFHERAAGRRAQCNFTIL